MDLPIQLRVKDVDEYTSYVEENKDEFFEAIIYGVQKALEERKDEFTLHEVAFMDLRSTYSVYYEEGVYLELLEKAIEYLSQSNKLTQEQSDILLDGINLKNMLQKESDLRNM